MEMSKLPSELLREIKEQRKSGSLNYRDLLNLGPNASKNEIETAYDNKRREYDLEKHLDSNINPETDTERSAALLVSRVLKQAKSALLNQLEFSDNTSKQKTQPASEQQQSSSPTQEPQQPAPATGSPPKGMLPSVSSDLKK